MIPMDKTRRDNKTSGIENPRLVLIDVRDFLTIQKN